MPIANNVDLQSPLGVSVFSNAIRELEGLDVAWTRLDDETYDSQHITFLGDSLIEESGKPVRKRRSSGGIVDKIGRALPRKCVFFLEVPQERNTTKKHRHCKRKIESRLSITAWIW